MFLKKHKILLITTALCWLVAFFLMFAITGHDWLGRAIWGFSSLPLCYAACHTLRQYRPVRRLRNIATVCLIVGMGYFCVVESFIIADARTDTHCTPDTIIVLGAGVNGTTPSLSLSDRLRATAAYMDAHPQVIAIVSGGKGDGENITEAQCMYNWLTDYGIDPDRILMEPEATSTRENLLYSMALLAELGIDDTRIGIVSSDYHLHRAKRLARHLGLDPVGIAADTNLATVKLNYFIREAFAMTEQYVFGFV